MNHERRIERARGDVRAATAHYSEALERLGLAIMAACPHHYYPHGADPCPHCGRDSWGLKR